MTPAENPGVSEDRQSLWALILPPAMWAAHFIVSYSAAAVWCGAVGRHAPLGASGFAFMALTVAALAGIVISGRRGWSMYRHGGEKATHHRDTAGDRLRFLGLATVLLAALSGIATAYTALAVAVVRNCS